MTKTVHEGTLVNGIGYTVTLDTVSNEYKLTIEYFKPHVAYEGDLEQCLNVLDGIQRDIVTTYYKPLAF